MTVFENELWDMTEAAVPLVTDAFGLDWTTTEFGYGPERTYRTDIAGVTWNPDAVVARRDELGDATLKRLNVKPYRMMRRIADDGGFISKGQWREGSGWTSAWKRPWDDFARKSILRLEDEPDGRSILAARTYLMDVPIVGDQWAVELKQGASNWERAIRQARRAFDGIDRFRDPAEGELDSRLPPDYNTGYANRAVVVMDADHVGAAVDHADVFEQVGVGLASLDRDELTVHVDPARQDQDRTRSRLELNEAALRDGWPDP